MNNKHVEFEQHLRDWLIAHDGQRGPAEICPVWGVWGWLGKLSQELLAEHLKDAKG